MKEKAIERWRATRKLGKLRFILITGVLSWGLPMFIVLTFFLNDSPPTPVNIAISFIVCVLAGGSAFGLAMWIIQEKQFIKATGESGA